MGKNILLAISGGIAAYKAPDLVRKLKLSGHNVRVVLTQSASHFVSSLSLQAVSGYSVSDSLLDEDAEAAMGHIELAKWANVLLVAPATANIIAKFANGIADDLISTLYLATNAKVVIAPAMNKNMWEAPATQRNIAILANDGAHFVGPESGEQACGDVGVGRMTEPEDIALQLNELIINCQPTSTLAGKKIVITAGPTRENLDPVRFISNYSSGKMGFCIAKECSLLGANVTLISGPVSMQTPEGCERIDVTTAQQMYEKVLLNITDCDIFIATAAVADYRPASISENKIKKQINRDELTLTLVKNPDILASVAKNENAPFTVGFAAESQNVTSYATRKLETKGIDLIAANDITSEGLGFNSNNNALQVIWRDGSQSLDAQPKTSLAKALMQIVAQRYEKRKT